MTQRKTHKDYLGQIKVSGLNVTPIENYISMNTPIKHKCNICGNEYDATPTNVLKSKFGGCSKCRYQKLSFDKKMGSKEYIQRIIDNNLGVTPMENYINANTPIKHKCDRCGYEWDARPGTILIGKGCPMCAGHIKTDNDYKRQIKELDEDIEVVGKYINNKTPIEHYCKKCHRTWMARPYNILSGKGCPHCSKGAHTSWMDRTTFEVLSNIFPTATYTNREIITNPNTSRRLELDVYIPELKVAFEPGSWNRHKSTIEIDKLKRELCAEKGIKCITIYDSFPTEENPPFTEDCYTYPKDFGQNKNEYIPFLKNILKENGFV